MPAPILSPEALVELDRLRCACGCAAPVSGGRLYSSQACRARASRRRRAAEQAIPPRERARERALAQLDTVRAQLADAERRARLAADEARDLRGLLADLESIAHPQQELLPFAPTAPSAPARGQQAAARPPALDPADTLWRMVHEGLTLWRLAGDPPCWHLLSRGGGHPVGGGCLPAEDVHALVAAGLLVLRDQRADLTEGARILHVAGAAAVTSAARDAIADHRYRGMRASTARARVHP